MAIELIPQQQKGSVSAHLHKHDAVGVPARQWYVLRLHTRTEFSSQDLLQSMGYETYVAFQEEMHVYPNRTRRKIKKVKINSIIFVRATEKERLSLLPESSNFLGYIINTAGRTNDYGKRPVAVIPDEQIEQLKYFLGQTDIPVEYCPEDVRVGDDIRVIRGQFLGYEGKCIEEAGKCYLTILLNEMLGSIRVRISRQEIELVKPRS